MELKVWVEGIQRIVCGVNEKTTCQDVVYALAHATGKTGRFTLIERWRNSERLLAPNEQPLKVLLKWGEHSNDVQFILQWSPLDSTVAKSGGGGVLQSVNQQAQQNKPVLPQDTNRVAPDSSHSNTSSFFKGQPSSTRLTNGPSNKEHGHSGGANDNSWRDSGVPGVFRGVQNCVSDGIRSDFVTANHNGKSISGGVNELSSPSKMKDFNVSGPPPYREPPNPISQALGSPGHNPSKSSSSLVKGLPPYREPPPPNLNHLQQRLGNNNSPVLNSSHTSASGTHSVNASMGNHTIFSNPSGGISTSNMVSSSSASNVRDISKISNPYDSLTVSSPSDKPEGLKNNLKTQEHTFSNGEIPLQNQNGSLPKLSPVPNSSPQYREIIHVVNLQRERLSTQQAELTQFDAELQFWEGKAREQQRQMELITKEIARMELVSAQHESQAMSLAHLEEENDLMKQESGILQNEVGALKSELGKCEGELNQCKMRIRLLMDELHTSQAQMAQRKEDLMMREAATLSEIDRLKKELDVARRDTDVVSDISANLDSEYRSLEVTLIEKKKQMERLLAAMKEANLQSLTIQPPDELNDNGAHHRSGSTRRMIGSPRQLENAAPTSKNPHGVWV